jgi:hypothetical protein
MGRVPRGAVALVIALASLTSACRQDVTRVRLEFRADGDTFRPDYVSVFWQTGGKRRQARVPANGSFAPKGDLLGTALISLDENDTGERRFVARGYRGEEVRVSGAVATVPFSRGRESSVNMSLGCYDDPDPDLATLPACGGSPPRPDGGGDGGTSDSAGDLPADLPGDRASDG